MASYFEVAKGVLLNAGVALVNPDYDPDLPYSQEILITKPERIWPYDETKMELDCTVYKGFQRKKGQDYSKRPGGRRYNYLHEVRQVRLRSFWSSWRRPSSIRVHVLRFGRLV
jgi:hypothetical protein